MKPIAVIFYGRSGSGKGTQASLLSEYLKTSDVKRKVIHVETGERFRNFVDRSNTYTATRIKDVMSKGGLVPAFFPIWTWSSLLIEEFTGDEHLIFDGVARRLEEAPILDSALKFFERKKPVVINLEVPEHEVSSRLIKRGRHDDVEEKIAERLRWFGTDVVPVLDYFKGNDNYDFKNIDGHQSMEAVHKEIIKVLGI